MFKEYLLSLILAFLLALPIAYLFVRLKLPPLTGFLLAGLLAGPSGFSLVKDLNLIRDLAELGVIFLMFLLGIEFSIKKLLSYRKEVLLGGFLQVVMTTLFIGVVASHFLSVSFAQALFYGVLVAFSSTAVVLKLLMERGELNSPYGRYIFGILIFQDLSVILVMLMLPLLSGKEISLQYLLFTLIKSFLILAGIFLIGFKGIPLFLDLIMKTRNREIFLISIFIISLGTAYLGHELGLSMALGAFLAGLIISESDYAYQIMAEIKPLKELFMALFFISVGMLLHPRLLFENPFLTLSIFAIIFVAKVLIAFGVVLLLSKSPRISLLSALYLFQIGEFSFVLALEGAKRNLFSSANFYQIFIGTSILTLVATPFVVSGVQRFSDGILRLFSPKRISLLKRRREKREERFVEHTVVVGFGICGKNVVYGLKLLKIPYVILELNPYTVKKYKRKGEPIYFADATNPEILKKFGIERAKALVITISDTLAARKIIQIAKALNPELYVITRTQFVAEIEELLDLGADEVIPEEFEASIELFTKVLKYYRVPKNLILELVEEVRSGHYQVLRKEDQSFIKEGISSDWLKALNFETYFIKKGSLLKGLSIKRLDLRAKTGVTILAIKRGEDLIINPSPDFILEEEDLLILIGDKKNLRKAFEYLEEPLEALY
ncbi:MAG: hypothetical protein C0197_05955 [Caldimicrobium thiodismutans]|uniref:Potassium transporter KefB n=1 Tax=Caldimicrobium thiodismutans TaxID=1653476 RepID=A0A2N7PIE2_9BACT|nr:MAG: hypothetical protein C0197_05955 [Caldimicrobium thiodismutans]